MVKKLVLAVFVAAVALALTACYPTDESGKGGVGKAIDENKASSQAKTDSKINGALSDN